MSVALLPSTKSLRQSWRRKLEKEGLASEFDLAGYIALAHLLYQTLQDGSAKKPASKAVHYAAKLTDRSIAAHRDTGRLACAKGCAFCCHQYVSATAPEIFVLADGLREHAERSRIGEALAGAATMLAGLSYEARQTQRLWCPVLDRASGACQAYRERPIACRGYVSFDVEACKRKLDDQGLEPPVSRAHINLSNHAKVALWSALVAAGREGASYDIREAVAAIWDVPDAEQRWLAGENLFARLQPDAGVPPEFRAIVRQIGQGARAGLPAPPSY